MLTLYLIGAIVGTILILLSLFGGHGDHSADHSVDHSGEMVSADGHDHPGDASHFVEWLPFLSLRFWTYFCAGFGLIGTVLTFFQPAQSSANLTIAIVSGLVLGLSVWLVMKWATKSEVGRSITPSDLVGKTGRIIVACRPGQVGKVRLDVRGDTLDLIASDESQGTLEIGEEVIVTRMDQMVAQVMGLSTALEDQLENRT